MSTPLPLPPPLPLLQGNPMNDGVTAVEGGRWSESVAAAKGSFKKIFALGSRGSSRQSRGGGRNGGRSRGGRGGRGQVQGGDGGGRGRGRSPQGGRSGRGYSQEWHPHNGNLQRNAYGGSNVYGGAGRGSGQGDGSGDGWGGAGSANGDGGRSAGGQGEPWSSRQGPQQQQLQRPGGLSGADGGGRGPTEASAAYLPPPPSPPPPPSSFPPSFPAEPAPFEGAAGSGGDGGGPGTDGQPPATVEGGTGTLQSPGSDQQQNLYGQLAPPRPPSGVTYPPPPPDLAAGRVSAAGVGVETGSGLDPKEVEAFYAAQTDYGDSGAPIVDGEQNKFLGVWICESDRTDVGFGRLFW